MRKVYSIAALAVMALIFQGCGLKGPLRLPERAKPATETTTSATPSDKTKEQ